MTTVEPFVLKELYLLKYAKTQKQTQRARHNIHYELFTILQEQSQVTWLYASFSGYKEIKNCCSSQKDGYERLPIV
jgi:hypothetical protein